MRWQNTMRTKDKEDAKILVDKLSEIRKEYGESFERFAKEIEYPRTSVWRGDEVNPHFRRILVELKILSLTGKTFFKV